MDTIATDLVGAQVVPAPERRADVNFRLAPIIFPAANGEDAIATTPWRALAVLADFWLSAMGER